MKRTDRGAIQIGLELTKIAGDIATLTGVGAQVGTPLKMVAAGVGKLPLYDENDTAIVGRYNQVQSLVEAAGVSIQALYQFENDSEKLKSAIVEAMGKRE